MRTISVIIAGMLMIGGSHVSAQEAGEVDLIPRYVPQPQTDEQRLETFTPPSPPPVEYPNIGQDQNGEGRLNITPDTSLGGSLKDGGLEGNIRFPIPE